MTKVLITGGAGFIGSHLADHLTAAGHAVNILDDFSSGRLSNLHDARRTGRVSIFEGNVLSDQNVRIAMAGCDVVFHLAVKSVRHSLGAPLENHAVNAEGTLRVLETARQQGIARFVYCSSSEVYGSAPDKTMHEDCTVCRPVTVYGASKLAGEHLTAAYRQTYGLPTVIVRPFNAYGPRAQFHGEGGEVIPRFMARILSGLPPVIFGDGRQSRDFTHVTEIAHCIAAAANVDDAVGSTINIAFGKATSILSLAETVAAVCGRTGSSPQFKPPRPGDVRTLFADTTRCQSLLGFKPSINLAQGLASYADWLKASGYDTPSLVDARTVNWKM